MKYGLSDAQFDELIQILTTYPEIEEAVLFGSRALGTYKEASDVDIALKGEKVTAALAAKLKYRMEEETYQPFFYDFVAYPTITNEALKGHIDGKGVCIYRRGWRECKLGEVMLFGNGRTRPMTEGQFPVYGGNGILCYADQYNYEGETIIIGRVGAYCGSIYFEGKPIWISDNALSAKSNGDNDTKFLFYHLKNLGLNKLAEGSSHPLLTQGLLNSIDIKICNDLNEQKAIASVLSSLDDKIELLNRQNKTLEGMAGTLFRQWFVEGVQEEWLPVKVGDFVKTNFASINKDYGFNEIKYLDTGSITEGRIDGYQMISLNEAPSRARRMVKHNDILISTVRPNQKHYGILKNPEENLIVSTGFCVITCEEINPHFIYLLLTTNDMTEYLHSIAEGSTSTYPSLKPSDIERVEFQMPPEQKLKAFSEFANSTWEKIDFIHIQIQTLTKLRDTLIPKLMSGEVRVAI